MNERPSDSPDARVNDPLEKILSTIAMQLVERHFPHFPRKPRLVASITEFLAQQSGSQEITRQRSFEIAASIRVRVLAMLGSVNGATLTQFTNALAARLEIDSHIINASHK